MYDNDGQRLNRTPLTSDGPYMSFPRLVSFISASRDLSKATNSDMHCTAGDVPVKVWQQGQQTRPLAGARRNKCTCHRSYVADTQML